MTSYVTSAPFASAEAAQRHFEQRLQLEADSWDVHQSIVEERVDFVLLDIRGSTSFGLARIPGAINIPYGDITEERLAQFSRKTNFVVYGEGAHCNAAHKAALRLAKLGRPVKELLAGMAGWNADGFAVDRAVPADASAQ